MNKINYIRMGYDSLMIHHKLSDMLIVGSIFRYETSETCIYYLRNQLNKVVL